jgi:hypothetical protein
MKWVGDVARMRRRGMHIGFWWEIQKRPLERPTHRWQDNIKRNLREMGWGVMDWIHLAQDRDPWRALVNMVLTFGFHKMLGNS